MCPACNKIISWHQPQENQLEELERGGRGEKIIVIQMKFSKGEGPQHPHVGNGNSQRRQHNTNQGRGSKKTKEEDETKGINCG